ncbi:MAG: DNA polymerase I [Ruminococcaceae bacterium]|nr:DNA polymerase I [Oscillospiraceae bacterium]
MKKLLVIDGNSILNRAFYGIRPLSTKDGLPTNAVYGMTNILWGKLEQYKPDYAAVAFDLKAPTFRHKEYDLYKANRHGMPDELAQQLPYAKQCCEAMGLHTVSLEGYEADDILGTFAEMASKEGIFSYILTGDRDSLQLIDDNTNILLATNNDTLTFDTDAFVAKYGVTPDVFVDVKALMGDSSDNIPGVAGIGEKTALKLISEYHDLENLYEKFEGSELTKGVKTKLRDGKDNAYLSRFLAKINCDVPLDITLDDIAYNGFKTEELAALLTRLEFSAMLSRLDFTPKAESLCCEAEEVADISEIAVGGEYSFTMDSKKAYISDANKVYFSVYNKEILEKLFTSEAKIAVFDSKTLRHTLLDMGIEPKNISFDIMLCAYVLNASERMYKAQDVAIAYLGGSFDDATGEAMALYKLYKVLDERMEDAERRLFYEIELPLARVLCDMERQGFKVDTEGLKEYGAMLTESLNELEQDIYELATRSFNINSPKQLGEILFEVLELPTFKKTKSGYSTNAEVLEKLRPYHPIIDKILEYRQISKLNSTYAIGLLNVADSEGKIHTTFNQTITATGRLSSTEPNLQNIPVRTELGRELRKYFIPTDSNHVLIDADYSQIELRLLAEISGDETMTEAFEMGIDIHTLTASQVFRVFPEAVTSELRKRAKAVNFGIVYGIGDYSLAMDIGVTKKRAGEYIRGYLDTYPGIDAYLKNVVEEAREKGFVTTLMGRKRYIPELTSQKKTLVKFGERVAMNSPIQGTAADIIKIAMINTADRLKKELPDAHLILQVHDELIVEATLHDADKAMEILVHEMENAYETRVPLSVEANMGASWYDAK